MGYQTQFTLQTRKNYNKIFKPLKRIVQSEPSKFPENIQFPDQKMNLSNYNQLRKCLKHHYR
ncbi:hypothetical protein [Candidatus Lokiarchaeum ossiferum]